MAINPTKILILSIFLFIVYYLQGIIYASGSLISQLTLFMLLFIGTYYSFKTFLTVPKPFPLSIWLFFIFMLSISYLISPPIVWGNIYEAIGLTSTFSQFKESLLMGCMPLLFFQLSKNTHISNKILITICASFTILGIIRFFYTQAMLQASLNRIDITNNAAYMILNVLPYLIFILKKKKGLAFSLFLILTILIMIGVKRGAIISLLFSIIFSILFHLKTKKEQFSSLHLFYISGIAIGISIFIYTLYKSNEYLQIRLEGIKEEDVGTRSIAYSTLFNYWMSDNNLLTILFGNGTAQSIAVWGNYAHNDWLELLIDHGILGVVTYFFLLSSLFIYIFKSNLDFYSRWSAYLCLIIWCFRSLFSMGYTDGSNAMITLLLGILIGQDCYYNRTNN